MFAFNTVLPYDHYYIMATWYNMYSTCFLDIILEYQLVIYIYIYIYIYICVCVCVCVCVYVCIDQIRETCSKQEKSIV